MRGLFAFNDQQGEGLRCVCFEVYEHPLRKEEEGDARNTGDFVCVFNLPEEWEVSWAWKTEIGDCVGWKHWTGPGVA